MSEAVFSMRQDSPKAAHDFEREISLRESIDAASQPGSDDLEYAASEIRRILQGLFPQRRLVLSQFTFFNQVGVAKPTGSTFRRGRRCYRLEDVLSIACILSLKEEGIPLKNIESVPALIQEHAERIFRAGIGTRLSGYGSEISLSYAFEEKNQAPLDALLSSENDHLLFWSIDVGLLAAQLRAVAQDALRPDEEKDDVQRAA